MICYHFFAAYSKVYDTQIALIKELQVLVPDGAVQLGNLIAPVRCQQRSINTNDKKLALKCLQELVPRALATVPKFLPYPALEGLLLYAAVLVLKLILQFSLGIGTINDVNQAYKSVVIRMIKDVNDLKVEESTKPTFFL